MSNTRKKFTFRKVKTLIASLCLASMLCTVPAFASNHYFSFEFKDLKNYQTASYSKSDNDCKWYVSLDRWNGLHKNNLSSANIFGCKMHRDYNDGVSIYHTISNYVTGFPFDYTTSVSKNDSMFLGAKKDSASTSSANLKISGRFAP